MRKDVSRYFGKAVCDDSKSILEPLKTRIKATDELMDEIVYRLYGLTEEEIKSIKGRKSA